MDLLSWTDRPDCEIIPRLLALHCAVATPRILDVTANRGQMWQGSGYAPAVRVDIDAGQGPDVVADCRALPFAAGTFDVITFDPPHIPGAGPRHRRRNWIGNYGLGTLPNARGNGVVALFTPFLRAARRVLRPDGLILAKLSDGVYHDSYRWHHVAFVSRVERMAGLRACDVLVKVRPGPASPTNPSQPRQYHGRAAHSYWIVVRKGACQGPGVARARRPVVGVQAPLFAAPASGERGAGADR